MHKHFTIQFFFVAIVFVLSLIFYILLAAEVIIDSNNLNFIESFILIIIAIILLGIYSILTKIENSLRSKK